MGITPWVHIQSSGWEVRPVFGAGWMGRGC